MTGFVVGDQAALLLGDDPGLALGTGDHPVDRLFHLHHGDLGLAATGRQKGSLVDQVGEVGAGEARGATGQNPQLHVRTEGLALGVDLENALPPEDVGCIDHDLAVKTPGTKQSRIEDVGPVGGGDDDDTVVGVESVEFDQQLVERLLPFVVPTTEAGAAMTADGIDFVDEDDRRSVALGLLEQVADPGSADAYEHLDEIRPRDREERNARLHRPPPWREGSCPSREARRGGHLSGSWRRGPGTCRGSGGSPLIS